jgi:hypothetical protein
MEKKKNQKAEEIKKELPNDEFELENEKKDSLDDIENAPEDEFSDSDLRATYLRPSQAERERLEREAKTEQ